MSWTFCETAHVKTRKNHKCVFCGRVILAGSINILNWHGLYKGDFQNSYSCHWCEDNKDRLLTDDNEIGEFWDSIREDLYYDKIQELRKIHEDIGLKLDGDYLVFLDGKGIEVHKEYMPVIRKDDI